MIHFNVFDRIAKLLHGNLWPARLTGNSSLARAARYPETNMDCIVFIPAKAFVNPALSVNTR
jgi:hypothetical protein